MLAGILDPNARVDALHARLAPLRPTAESEIIGDGLAIVTDGLAVGGVEGRGLVLDGTIDNLPQLALDARVAPDASAATILAATLSAHGERMPERLRGDFAVIAWDMPARSVWLAQDQIGVGALFWSSQEGAVCFGSEVHLVLALLRRRPSPDEAAVLRYLTLAEPAPRGTLYRGVQRLGAGRRLSCRGAEFELTRYHELTYQAPFTDSRLDVTARLRGALLDAVTVRTASASSVGITLSGGFDSSVVAGAAATSTVAERLYGYSATFPGVDGMDDRDLLDVLVDAYGLANRRYANEPGGMLATAVEYTSRYSLPLAGPGWVTEIPLLRRAHADGVAVLLDGQGGDETFGATPYLVADHLRHGRPDRALALIRHGFLGAWRGVPGRVAARMIAEYGARPLAPAALRAAVRAWRDPGRYAPAVLSPAAARTLAVDEDPFSWTRGTSAPLWWLHLRHLLTAFREDGGLGDYVRQRSAWFGLHGRSPLFDLGLTETTLRVAPELRFDAHLDRPIGRDAVAGLVPDAIRLSRRKSNLAPFYYRGLLGADRPLLTRLLRDRELEIARWVRRDVVTDLLARPPAEPVSAGAANRWTSTIWALVSAELWLRCERHSGAVAGLGPAPLRSREI